MGVGSADETRLAWTLGEVGVQGYDLSVTTKRGKLADKTAAVRAQNVRKATSRVKAKTSIDFARSVRGR
jgi:hypothetical protein